MARSKSSTHEKIAGLGCREARSAQHNGADPALRPTGIRVVGDMPWGTHICVFHESNEDLLDTATFFFAAGLRGNEFCVWVISDPITQGDARDALRRAVPDLDQRLAAGQIEILQGKEWYLEGGRFELECVLDGWSAKLDQALANGYDGLRVSGPAFWFATDRWKAFCEYEQELDRSLAGRRMIALCTYPLHASSAVDVLDAARAHQFSIARRNGNWEFLETQELGGLGRAVEHPGHALDVPPKPFPRHELLTPRERATLAQIVKGASSKEAARALGVSPRTVEFHRANIMKKLDARNSADLVRKVLGD